jgi:hypothetical protein
MRCPRCQNEVKLAESFLGGPCLTWYACVKCNTYIHTYIPLKHQAEVHKDAHHVIGNFGGYGTGKTTTDREEIIKHILITPNANILAGAGVQSQYEQTLKREFEMDIPKAFVRDYSAQKQHMDFINGARLMWRPFDDPNKIRSYTISMGVLLEASEIKGEVYQQARTRLRNMSATIPYYHEDGSIVYEIIKGRKVPKIHYDWRKLFVESNPDSGWIKSEVLLRSEMITQYETSWNYVQDPDKVDKDISSHVAATSSNPMLPVGFEDGLRRSNPEWWVKRYLEGSFQYSEGLVYPGYGGVVITAFPIPKTWKRMIAFDYGIADTAVFLFGAIDPITGAIHIYKNVFGKDRNIEKLAQMYKLHSADIPSGGMYGSPLIDPKSGPKRDYNLVTLTDHFLDYGISFQPGQINVDARIYRTNTYIESGKVKIHDNCTFLIEELSKYKFPERTMSDPNKKIDKPVDKDNHAINCMEWILSELPADPRQVLGAVYNPNWKRQEDKEPDACWQLSDTTDDQFRKDATQWWR